MQQSNEERHGFLLFHRKGNYDRRILTARFIDERETLPMTESLAAFQQMAKNFPNLADNSLALVHFSYQEERTPCPYEMTQFKVIRELSDVPSAKSETARPKR